MAFIFEGFRWRNDDGSKSTATWAANQDANITYPKDSNLRLRILTDIATANEPLGSRKIQFRGSGGTTPTTWTDVGGVANKIEPLGSAVTGTGNLTISIGSGTNRALIVAVGCEGTVSSSAPTVTYGGQSMTVLKEEFTGSSTYNIAALYFLNDAGIENATNTTVSISTSNGNTASLAQAYTGVTQTGAQSTWADSSSTSTNPLTSINYASDLGEIIIACASQGNLDGNTPNWTGTNPLSDAGQEDSGSMSMVYGTNSPTGVETVNVQHTWTVTPNRSTIVSARLLPSGTTSEKINLANSTYITDRELLTNFETTELTPPAGKGTSASYYGTFSESEIETIEFAFTTSQYTEDEFCLEASSTDGAADGDVFEFRMVESDGTAYTTYSVTCLWTIGPLTDIYELNRVSYADIYEFNKLGKSAIGSLNGVNY